MNTVRIVVIAIAEAKFQLNLADGAAHEILGLVLFSFTFIASMSTDQLLEFLLSPIQVQPGDTGVRHNPLVRLWNWGANYLSPQVMEPNAEQATLNQRLAGILTPKLTMTAVPIALVGVWSVMVFLGVVGGKPAASVEPLAVSQSITAEHLPESVGVWKRASFEASDKREGQANIVGNYDFGQFSNIYQFDGNELKSQVSMDFPFTGGWHELSACYRASGWEILERNARTEGGRDYVETLLKFPDQEQYGYLLFNNFNQRGEVFTPPSGAILLRSWLFIRRRFLQKITGDLYQVQTFVTSEKPFTEEDKAEAKKLFFEAEKKLTAHVASLSG